MTAEHEATEENVDESQHGADVAVAHDDVPQESAEPEEQDSAEPMQSSAAEDAHSAAASSGSPISGQSQLSTPPDATCYLLQVRNRTTLDSLCGNLLVP